ncbi:MAG: hypothetical protein H6553_08945 [Chitinophagales bacterium]|nr:hypothetical protein [Chitinophagales bacterium]
MSMLICQNYVSNFIKDCKLSSYVNNLNDLEEDAHKVEVKDFVIKYIKQHKAVLSSIIDKKISMAHLTDDAIENQNYILFIGEPPEYLA